MKQNVELSGTRLDASETRNEFLTQASHDSGRVTVAAVFDASRYCPVCSQRLESLRCKLICNVCGYYMSCADYY